MNGNIDRHDPTNGYYTGNAPIFRNSYTSSFTPNTSNNYFRYSYSPCEHENSHQQKKQQSTNLNVNYSYMTNLQQQPQQQYSNFDEHGFDNGESSLSSSSMTYYNRVYAQVRSNTPTNQHQNNLSIPSAASKNLRVTPTFMTNGRPEQFFLMEPTNDAISASPRSQSPMPSQIPVMAHSTSNSLSNDDDPSPDYLHYTMDSLIQRLVPSDTYIPKQSFIYAMLLCSRMHIQPSILLNKLGNLTLNTIQHLTRERGVRILTNFLYVLSQWTRTFPYDFRNTDMLKQLEGIYQNIHSYESNFQSETYHMKKKLLSKLKALESYEEYIRQINTKALNSLTRKALCTDIMNECPTPLLFAQQLTHIELDRLKPIGAEEFIQYFIMKLSSEEARAHPNRTFNSQTSASINSKSLEAIHDKKLTSCLETYVDWLNHLTSFVTTEIIKHRQKRSRVRLINYFIDAAYECLRLHNFNSMIGLIGGLNKQPVKRLRRTWEKIQLEKFEQLEQYTNVSKNFSNYRLILKSAMEEAEKNKWGVDKIVIPFSSIIVQDVYYIKTHSKDYTIEGGINLKKYYSMAKFISEEFIQCKQSKCSFERNDVIINYITTSPTFIENSLMLASFECEPPATANEKEKLNMLQATVNTSS